MAGIAVGDGGNVKLWDGDGDDCHVGGVVTRHAHPANGECLGEGVIERLTSRQPWRSPHGSPSPVIHWPWPSLRSTSVGCRGRAAPAPPVGCGSDERSRCDSGHGTDGRHGARLPHSQRSCQRRVQQAGGGRRRSLLSASSRCRGAWVSLRPRSDRGVGRSEMVRNRFYGAAPQPLSAVSRQPHVRARPHVYFCSA